MIKRLINPLLLMPDGGEGGGESDKGPVGAQGQEKSGAQEQDILDETKEGDEKKDDDKKDGAVEGEEGDDADKASGLSKDDIKEILREAGVGQQASQQGGGEKAKELSAEDFEKAFNVFKPNNDLLVALRNEDPKVALAAIETLRDGLLKQAMTMAEYRVQGLIKELRDKDLAPLATFVEEQRNAALADDFYKKYPDLKEHVDLVDAVSAKLVAGGLKGSRDKVFKAFAEGARKILKQISPKGEAGGEEGDDKTSSSNGTSQRSKMSTLTTGGQSGGRTTTTGKTGDKKLDSALAVFD